METSLLTVSSLDPSLRSSSIYRHVAASFLTFLLVLASAAGANAQFIYNDVITGIQNDTSIANAELAGLQSQVSSLCAQAQQCKGNVSGAVARRCEQVQKQVERLHGYRNDIASFMDTGINGRISALNNMIQSGQGRIVSGTLQMVGCEGGTTQGCVTPAMNALLGPTMAGRMGAVFSGAQAAQQMAYNFQCPLSGAGAYIDQYFAAYPEISIIASVSMFGCTATGTGNNATTQQALQRLRDAITGACLPGGLLDRMPQLGIPNIPNLPTVNIPQIPGLPGLPDFPTNIGDFASQCGKLNFNIPNIKLPTFKIPGINLPTLPQVPDICQLPQLPNCNVQVNTNGTPGSTTINGGGR